MAEETKIIRYGDKTFALDAGMTLDQARQVMARHFPELADPEIKTEKEGGATVYVFSKRAGRKGAQPDGPDAATALFKLPPVEVIPAQALTAAAVLVDSADPGSGVEISDAFDISKRLEIDAQEVGRITTALLGLPSAIAIDGSVLL